MSTSDDYFQTPEFLKEFIDSGKGFSKELLSELEISSKDYKKEESPKIKRKNLSNIGSRIKNLTKSFK